MAEFDRFLVGLFSVIFFVAVASDKVPVLIWNNQITHSFPKVLSGKTVGKETFENSYLDEITKKKQNLVLFLQDKLSLDDITKYADVYDQKSDGATYKNLKSLMEEHGSAQLPSVDSAARTMSDLKAKFSGKVHELKDSYSTKDIPLDSENNFMIVHLPKTGNKESDFKKDLSSIDNIIGKVSSELKSSGKPFTAIYTAEKNSNPPTQSLNVGRHLLAAGNNTSQLINITDCLLLYAGEMKFRNGNTTWNLTDLDTDGSSCTNETAQLKIKYTNASPKLTLNMDLTFERNMAYYIWTLANWTVNYQHEEGKSEGDIYLKTAGIGAPLMFSYACFQQPELKVNTKLSNVSDLDIGVTIKAFQVEAFMSKTKYFGRDNNCVGFFSIGVWSMLITLFVLLLVLIPGVMMLANIRVMDRFDDPKAKGVTINVLD